VVRRVFLVVVLAAAASSATGLVYDTISAPSRLSADAPRNLDRPVLRRAGTVGDEVQFNPYELEWRSPVRGVPFQLRYSWLRCDLNGANCSPLAGLSGKTIAPPQEERIVTLRGVVTGTNRYGSRSVVTRNFYYDMAGLAFGVGDRRFVRNHLQYNPDQLRLTALFGHIGGLARRDRPSVVSDSWCEPCGGDGRRLPKLVREVVYPFVAGGCHLPHVVCVQAAGDHRIPGDPPSNSPYVLAVGGTEFKPTRDGAPSQEILWPFSGSGVTTIPLPRPPWQKHPTPAAAIHRETSRARRGLSPT